jgi:hypothetical protein
LFVFEASGQRVCLMSEWTRGHSNHSKTFEIVDIFSRKSSRNRGRIEVFSFSFAATCTFHTKIKKRCCLMKTKKSIFGMKNPKAKVQVAKTKQN